METYWQRRIEDPAVAYKILDDCKRKNKKIKKKQLKAYEYAIANSPEHAFKYSYMHLNCSRFMDFEYAFEDKAILPFEYVTRYCSNILKTRWIGQEIRFFEYAEKYISHVASSINNSQTLLRGYHVSDSTKVSHSLGEFAIYASHIIKSRSGKYETLLYDYRIVNREHSEILVDIYHNSLIPVLVKKIRKSISKEEFYNND